MQNENGETVKGTVRIFMAPIYVDWKLRERVFQGGNVRDENNPHMESSFNKLRRMFVELDKFVTTRTYQPDLQCRKSLFDSVVFL